MKSKVQKIIIPFLVLLACATTGFSQNRPTIYALAWSPDGKKMVVGTHGRAILYDTATWVVTDNYTRISDAVRSAVFHPDGKTVALGSGIPSKSGELVLWDTTVADKIKQYAPAKDTIEAIAFAKSGESMVTASFDSKARLYPETMFAYSSLMEEHNGRVTAAAFSPKPNYVYVTGSMDKMVKVWDFKKTAVVVNFDQSVGGITGLGFLSNGDQFVGSSMDGNLYWWGIGYDARKRIYSGYHYRTNKAHEGGVTAFGESVNLQRMVTSGMDMKVKIWRVDDGGLVHEFAGPSQPIYATALSPDGKIAAAAGREGVIWIWDVEANKLLYAITPAPMVRLPAARVVASVAK